jgi:hypothetical protein
VSFINHKTVTREGGTCPACGEEHDGLHGCSDDTRSAALRELRAKIPRWTTEPPTKSGWYWAREKGRYQTIQVVLFQITPTGWAAHQVTCYVPPGASPHTPVEGFDLWCGPIEPPALPR